MKLRVNKKYLKEHISLFLIRKCSYLHIESYHTGKDSFVRTLTRDHYPRYHMYIRDEGDSVVLDLHLDQKKASYEGTNMHSGEYDGEVVSREMARIKQILQENL